MVKLAISRELLNSYSKLGKAGRSRAQELIKIICKSTAEEIKHHPGINLEHHENQIDPLARTLRIDRHHRGIVLVVDDELLILYDILTNDQADDWMALNQLNINPKTGMVEIYNVSAVKSELAAITGEAKMPGQPRLFEHRSNKEFIELGISSALIPTLRALTEDDELRGLLGVLPQGQAEALIALTGNRSLRHVYRHVAGDRSSPSVGQLEIQEALGSTASRSQFYVVSTESELQRMLKKPLEQWRIYLHQSQRDVAYRSEFNGPALVTGGAGTGKTTVAMHRAKFLASQPQLWDSTDTSKSILLTTFHRNLADALKRDLRQFSGDDLLDVVEIMTVDQLARRAVEEVEGTPEVWGDHKCKQLWKTVVSKLAISRSVDFLHNEWEQVILARPCRSRDDYLRVSRAGRGVPLTRKSREEVWEAVDLFTQKLAVRGVRTFLQVPDEAARNLARNSMRPYRHVIVDEAQDLHQSHWRMLRAIVGEGRNDILIVGDSHQRIYNRGWSLRQVGINVVGRAQKLRLNYRTTHEIMRWSTRLLAGRSFDDLDGLFESSDYPDYHSLMHGPEPTLFLAEDRSTEIKGLVSQVQQWIADGVRAEDIAVAARTWKLLEPVEAELQQSGIKVCRLGKSVPVHPGVRITSMHRTKGIEFRCVAVSGVSDDEVPAAWALTDQSADRVQHQHDLTREACLLYVACSRAREHLWVGAQKPPSRFLKPHLP